MVVFYMLAAICLAASLAVCPTVEVRPTIGLAHVDIFHWKIVVSPTLKLTEHERAFVLAHEIGHIVLLHSGLTGTALEIAVDRWAAETMTKIGYNCRVVRPFLKRIGQPQERIDAVSCH